MKAIREFFVSSYRSDMIAFYYEQVSFFFIVGASLTLAITAVDPDMRYIYPGYFVGSLTAVYAHIRRKLAWPTLLVGYFCLINLYGWFVAMQWI